MEEKHSQEPKSFRDRLKGLADSKLIFAWTLKNVITKQSKVWIRRVFVAVILSIGFAAAEPFIMAYIFKGLIAKDGKTVLYSVLGLCLCLQLKKIFELRKDKAREWIIGLHWGKLNTAIGELFYEKSVDQHIEHAGRLSVSHIDKGRGKILLLQQVVLFDGIPTLTTLSISLVCLFFLSWVSGLIMLFVLVVYVAWSLFLNVKVMQVCKPLEKKFRKLGNRVTERMEAVTKVKSFAKEAEEVKQDAAEFERVMAEDRTFWLWFLSVITWRSVFNALGYGTVVAWGSWQVWKGNYHIGFLYPLFAWAKGVSDNIWRLADIEHQINWHLPSVVAMLKSLTMKPSITVVDNPVMVKKESKLALTFDNIAHSYARKNNARMPVLRGVSFNVDPGEKVALIGPSGVGKSTLVSLVLRHMDPISGRVLVDGHDLKELHLGSYLRRIGYIPQTSTVFDGTIKENLLYGLSPEEQLEISDERLWEVMNQLKINFGERLDKGLDTHVGKSGMKLSGGQQQRLMVGTAVMKDPALMLIDEATSSQDSTTEKEVQAGLTMALSRDVSAIVIAHRLSSVRSLCTKFVIFRPAEAIDDGLEQIEAQAGSFEELWEVSPSFRRLATDQDIIVVPRKTIIPVHGLCA